VRIEEILVESRVLSDHIDLMLAPAPLSAHVVECAVDTEADRARIVATD